MTCTPGHRNGNKPHAQPVVGSDDFVVYHGGDYLNRLGTVVRFPVRMSHAEASRAITAHELTVELDES